MRATRSLLLGDVDVDLFSRALSRIKKVLSCALSKLRVPEEEEGEAGHHGAGNAAAISTMPDNTGTYLLSLHSSAAAPRVLQMNTEMPGPMYNSLSYMGDGLNHCCCHDHRSGGQVSGIARTLARLLLPVVIFLCVLMSNSPTCRMLLLLLLLDCGVCVYVDRPHIVTSCSSRSR